MIGIDICNISRFSNMKNIDKFLDRYFTYDETNYILNTGNRDETIAGIFSLKEAFVKAIGTGFGSVRPIDVEIIHNFSGKPDLIIHNDIVKKIEGISCSVSHDGDYAIAVVEVKLLNVKYENIDVCEIKKLMPSRNKDGHKGDFGKVGIIGGSIGMSGSVDLCAKSSLRTGSGLVYNICPKSISDILEVKAIENIILPISDDNKGYFTLKYIDEILNKISNLDAIAIGCGLGRNKENLLLLEIIFKTYKKPIVIDADAINFLKDIDFDIINRNNIIITPHEAEFSRFSSYDLHEIKVNREDCVNKFYKNNTNFTLVLKGKNTIVKSSEDIFINQTGNSGMATAGSGDCLTGIILSFLGQGLDAFASAKLGVFLHGLSGDFAEEEIGEDSLVASDIIKYLPKAIKFIRK